MTHPRRGERGFTLVELTVVLLVTAVVLAIIYPNLSGLFGRGAPRDTVRRLTDALTEARAEAIASQHSVRFSLGSDGRSWRIGGGEQGETAAGAALALAGAPLAGGPAIVFFPDGSSTGGRITVGERDTGRVIGVGWLTGRIADVTGSPP